MSAALDLLLGLRLEDGCCWGDAAADFQIADAAAVLDREGPRRHFQTRPRGASKTTDCAAVAIAALLEQLPPRSRSYVAAADRDQAALLIDLIAGFAARTDGLRGALTVEARKVINARTGATLEALAADESSSWGLLLYLLIVDEFSAWLFTSGTRRFWTSLYSALPKVADSRLVILTTAGDPAHPAYALLQRARKSSEWRVSETPGPVPWISKRDLAEQRAELPAWEFERLHRNLWTAPQDRLTTVDDLRACVVLDGPQEYERGRVYALAVDVGLVNDATVLVVCSHNGREPVVRLDLLRRWQGSRRTPVSLDLVEATVYEAWSTYGRPRVIVDPWQSAQLSQRLAGRRVPVTPYTFSTASVSKIALRLHGLIRDHALELPDDDQLLDELANVRLRETAPGVYRLDHDHSRHDDQAIALALAAEHLLARPLRAPRPLTGHLARGRIPGVTGPRDGLEAILHANGVPEAVDGRAELAVLLGTYRSAPPPAERFVLGPPGRTLDGRWAKRL
jgi:phage terminase large subunit-like protein